MCTMQPLNKLEAVINLHEGYIIMTSCPSFWFLLSLFHAYFCLPGGYVGHNFYTGSMK